MVTAVTNLIIAQRLARRVCRACRAPYAPSPAAVAKLRLENEAIEFHRGIGCAECGHTGYRGRVGIYEMLLLTPELQELVRRRATDAEMTEAAMRSGTRLLRDDARAKVSRGLTTPEEVLRVIRIADPRSSSGALIRRT